MLTPRIYHPAALKYAETVLLTENASRHIVSVLRLKAGDPFCLFNGDGNEYHVVLQIPDKRRAVVEITAIENINRESPFAITLAHGVARGEKMDFIIQKAVELGVKRFVPLLTEFGTVKLSADRVEKRLRHWEAVIISASEQCGRNCLMELSSPLKYSLFLASLNARGSSCLLLSPEGDETLSTLLLSRSDNISQDMTLLIGSEGGFSPSEIQEAKAQHCVTLAFGKRILRTETAGLAIVSALQSRFGDL
ncbi:MAG: uncharacterized protein K0R12_1348 [Gammaproteobacteria bacterium]|jgi:16S rRNA (uracil1498-N3)-methyltransferase|nr:uncharacterized protein [Gammaproteobacteria bacterium]